MTDLHPQLGLRHRAVETRDGRFKAQFRLLWLWHDSNLIGPSQDEERIRAFVDRQNAFFVERDGRKTK